MRWEVFAASVIAMSVSTAQADTASSHLGVSVHVTQACSITAGAMAFGSYDAVAGHQLDGQATLTVACSKGAIASITLGQGSNPGPQSSETVPHRQMKNESGDDVLSYTLYKDPTRLVAWGNTAATGQAYLPSSATPSAIAVYGRIRGSQDVVAGTYADTVVATVSF